MVRERAQRAWMAVVVLASVTLIAQTRPHDPPLDLFFRGASADERESRVALTELGGQWRDGYASMIIDLARMMRPAPRVVSAGGEPEGFRDDAFDREGDRAERVSALGELGAPETRQATRESIVRARLLAFLSKQTGKRFDATLAGWRQWMWALPYEPHADYAAFKGLVYRRIDPRMERFFPPNVSSTIRLDEIDWGGVTVNGIPPLSHPKTLAAPDARYLRDSHIVFGVVINGEARAYPKRILAWHEMAIDRIGGVEMTIVYCTLCGTVIPYESHVGGRLRRFGTSGLLYRSNKLMFDEETMSLWSTLEGKPVVGPLVNTGLEMTSHAAVTTTWGEWRAEHPETRVLSLETGHTRDYSEGAAYRDYFSNDRLYFQVPAADKRLKNKEEMLVMRVGSPGGGDSQPVAILAAFLKEHPVFPFEVAGRRFIVVTSRGGANRVYALGSSDVVFQSRVPGGVIDVKGRQWKATEDALVAEDGSLSLPRYAAQRAFWFGWYAQYPNTVLLGR